MSTHTDNEELANRLRDFNQSCHEVNHPLDLDLNLTHKHFWGDLARYIQANYTPRSNTDTNVGVTPQAAVQGGLSSTNKCPYYNDDCPKCAPTKSSGELEEILDDTIFDHEDDDHSTCASNYARCSQCGERVYWSSRHYHQKHTAPPQWIEDKCNCRVSKDKAELKAAILAWHTTQTTKLQNKRLEDFLRWHNARVDTFTVGFDLLNEFYAQLEREHKIGEDGE